jgi:hypothetical protein
MLPDQSCCSCNCEHDAIKPDSAAAGTSHQIADACTGQTRHSLNSVAAGDEPKTALQRQPAATSNSKQKSEQHSDKHHITNSAWVCLWLCIQVAIGLGALLWGPASDRYGRRPVLLIATALFALTNVPLILAPDVAVLLAFRTLQVGGLDVDSWCIVSTHT